MGQAKHNPTAVAARNGQLPPKKKPMGKRQAEARIKALIADRTGMNAILGALNAKPYM